MTRNTGPSPISIATEPRPGRPWIAGDHIRVSLNLDSLASGRSSAKVQANDPGWEGADHRGYNTDDAEIAQERRP